MDQPCKVAKPARGQLNREIKFLHLFGYITGIFFIWGLLYRHTCVTTVVYVYVVCMYGHHI